MPVFGHRMVVGNYKHARDYQAKVDKRDKNTSRMGTRKKGTVGQGSSTKWKYKGKINATEFMINMLVYGILLSSNIMMKIYI